MRRPDSYTPEEDEIIRRTRSFNVAFRKLKGRRTRHAIKHRRWLLKNLETPVTNQTRMGERLWNAEEEEIMRKHWPAARNAEELKPYLPRFTTIQIRSKAGHLKLKRLFNGDDDVPFAGHKELLDQIRIRARQDGVALYKLDMQLGTGYYFRASNWKKDKINLLYVARAIEFFGGSLVIDWGDR